MKSIMSLIISIWFLISCNQANESICLIPKNFTGVVVIIFDQKNGLLPEVENGKHVYRIPLSGVLRTQVKANYRVEGHEYYYVDSLEKRTVIPFMLPEGWEKIDTTNNLFVIRDIYVFNEEMGATAKNKPEYKKYRSFIIARPNEVDSLSNIKTRILFKELSVKTQ